MEFLYYGIGGAVCHQMPERSIEIGGRFLPLCARCTGIYGGIAIILIYFFIRKRLQGNQILGNIQAVIAAFSFFPFMIDGVGSYLGLWTTNNLIRILTGVCAGISLPYFIILLIHFDINGENDKPIFSSLREQVTLLCLGFALAYGIYIGKLVSYDMVSILLCAGVVCFYTMMTALIFSLCFHWRGKKLLSSGFGVSFIIILFIWWVRK